MAGKTENRGGKRPGAGRKPIFELSEAKRREILRDLDAVAQEKGSSLGKELGNMIFGRNKDKRMKLQAIRTVVSDVLPKSSERDVTVTEVKVPQIFMPEELPDTEESGDFTTTH